MNTRQTKTTHGLKQVNIYLEPEVVEELKSVAKADKRSLSSLVAFLIENHLATANKQSPEVSK